MPRIAVVFMIGGRRHGKPRFCSRALNRHWSVSVWERVISTLRGGIDVELAGFVVRPETDAAGNRVVGGRRLGSALKRGRSAGTGSVGRNECSVFEGVDPPHRHRRGIIARGRWVGWLVIGDAGGIDPEALNVRFTITVVIVSEDALPIDLERLHIPI